MAITLTAQSVCNGAEEFRQLRALDPSVEVQNYHVDGRWDVGGIKSDKALFLAGRGEQLSATCSAWLIWLVGGWVGGWSD